MTNGDRIRQMSNEELAEVLCDVRNCCRYCIGKYERFGEFDCSVIVNNTNCIEGIKAYLDTEVEE